MFFKRAKKNSIDFAAMKRDAEFLPAGADRKDLLDAIASLEAEERKIQPFMKAYEESERRSRRNELLLMLFLIFCGLAILSFPVRGVLEGRIVELGNGSDRYLYWNEFPRLFAVLVVAYCAMSAPFLLAGGFLFREDRRVANAIKRSRADIQSQREKLRTPEQILNAPRPLYRSAVTPEMRANFDRSVAILKKQNDAELAKWRPSFVRSGLLFAFGCMILFVTFAMMSGAIVLPKVCDPTDDSICNFENWLYGWGGRPAVSILWILVTTLTFSAVYFVWKKDWHSGK